MEDEAVKALILMQSNLEKWEAGGCKGRRPWNNEFYFAVTSMRESKKRPPLVSNDEYDVIERITKYYEIRLARQSGR